MDHLVQITRAVDGTVTAIPYEVIVEANDTLAFETNYPTTIKINPTTTEPVVVSAQVYKLGDAPILVLTKGNADVDCGGTGSGLVIKPGTGGGH